MRDYLNEIYIQLGENRTGLGICMRRITEGGLRWNGTI